MKRPTSFQRGAVAARRQVFEALRRIESLTKDAAALAKKQGADGIAEGLERDLGMLDLLRRHVRRQPLPVEKRGASRRLFFPSPKEVA